MLSLGECVYGCRLSEQAHRLSDDLHCLQAQYFGSAQYARDEYYHFGLAMDLYTHFTSPIRRYADILVHRLLAASLDLQPLPESACDKDRLKDVTDNLNVRHRNAQFAGRSSVTLFTLIYFK